MFTINVIIVSWCTLEIGGPPVSWLVDKVACLVDKITRLVDKT